MVNGLGQKELLAVMADGIGDLTLATADRVDTAREVLTP
jgi:hypothetical protein